MKKIRAIIHKEWTEVFKNRMVIFTVAFLPLVMAALPLGILYGIRGSVADEGVISAEFPSQLTGSMCSSGISASECLMVFMVSQFMVMFMIIPIAIPVTIAAYSIVGEKTTRSLEPLLATPITTAELLLGKCISAVIPAVVATYASYGIFALGSWLLVMNKALLVSLVDPKWLIAIFIVGPLLAVSAVTFSLMISSRVSDPRVAEQISMVIIVPVLIGFIGQMAGLFVLTAGVISWVAVGLLLLDILLIYFATKVFQRESILTRWR